MDVSKNQLKSLINLFALELYQRLSSDGGNLIVSPIGLQVLLAITLEGADGETASEIVKVLHHAKNDKDILQSYKSVLKHLRNPCLQFTTKLFVEKSFRIKENFKSLISEYFLSEIDEKDFNKRSDESRLDINKWVEENTNHKIKDLFPQGSISADVRLVMVNAIHFYAHWKTEFDEKNTVDMPFHVTPKKTVNVKMMTARKPFLFQECQILDAKIIRLPYVDETFSMVVVLPNELDRLSELENKLKSIDLTKNLSNLNVNLMLPRFKIEKNMDLNGMLAQQMPTAFSEVANFSGITNDSLSISKIVQKAFIEVNERGTEATAATGIVTETRSSRIIYDMKCDHPFFFQILKDDLIIFQGALIEPDSYTSDPGGSTSGH